MQTPDFDAYLNAVTNGILSKKARESVKTELADHLFIKYELLTAQGQSEEEAIKSAVEALGDKNVLRQSLAQVHAYRPDISMKKALHLLMAGLILSTFHINFFEGMEQIMDFIASVLTLTGVFCLAKANTTLKRAFVFYSVHAALSYAAYAFSPFYEGKIFIRLPMTVLTAVCQCAGVFFLLKGLKELVAPYEDAPHKPLRFDVTAGINIFSTLFACASSLILSMNSYPAENYSLASDAFVILLPVLILSLAGVILLLVLLSRVNRLLYAADHEYRIEDDTKKKALFAVCVCVFAVGLSLVTGYFYLKPSPTLTEYKADGNAAIAQVMKTYQTVEFDPAVGKFGEPDNIFSLLPQEETARYAALKPMDILREESDFAGYHHTLHYGNWFEEAYAFPIDEEHGEFRLLRRIILPENASGCRALLCTQMLKSYLLPVPANNNDTFILILSRDEYGRLCEQKPLRTYKDDLGIVYAFEFAAKPETQIIIGKTYCISYPGHEFSFNYATQLLTFNKPVFGFKRSFGDLKKKYGSYNYYFSPSGSYSTERFEFLMTVPFSENKAE